MISPVATALKIRITDIVMTHREVTAPTECPHCSASLVPTPDDDGFGPIFGTLVGQAENGRYSEPEIDGSVTPDLESVDDMFAIDEMAGTLVAYIACGNPECGRIILEGTVS